jgi:50S ribosomal protein L16 3-hydroxylase
LNFPSGLSADQFLATYWQRKPLLIRQALPGYDCPIEPNDLAGMAREEDVESRLVLEKNNISSWEARYGPFDEAMFSQLPESHWTLLVQDADKHLPYLTQLLDYFRFLPDWRLDDVMISYAVDQGSVGPHTDDYDVFLYQAKGRKRWHINTQPVAEDDYIPGIDLRIMPNFNTEKTWVLEPGDLLYLPPNIAHWGVAQGEAITCSVGFRAPTLQEMALAWFESALDQCLPIQRYRDPPLKPQASPAEILPSSLKDFKTKLNECLEQMDRDNRWFGRFITESKDHLQVLPLSHPIQACEFLNLFREHAVICHNSFTRFAFSRSGQDGYDELFANGTEYLLPSKSGDFLPVITHYHELHFGYLQDWLKQPELLSLLCQLYNDGHLLFPHEP